MLVDDVLYAAALRPVVDRVFRVAAPKIRALAKRWDSGAGAPVFTVDGKYTSRGWTEWTQGFQFGCQILQYASGDDAEFWRLGRANTFKFMPAHVSHTGVHDHGFNTLSTYGNLRRLAIDAGAPEQDSELAHYELAIQVSGAVQAARWTRLKDGTGYIHSFNGAHSLFSDTIRSCRVLVLAHMLGHQLMGENDRRISLLGRALEHLSNTSRYNVYYGEDRDIYDEPGRVVHESLFNTADGNYRCPSTQQGYSPFSTWTRGLAWVILGAAEQLEALRGIPENDAAWEPHGGKAKVLALLERIGRVTTQFYIRNSAQDGIVYWDTGAPGLANMPNWREQPAQIDNEWEPVDSSAAAITAQGMLRLGHYLGAERNQPGSRFWQAGLTLARTVLSPPYLSEDPKHEGLLLHTVYHRPNGWDHIPPGKKVPQGEAALWGDYHAMELALYLKRVIESGKYLTFF